jgi:hypothetical protein
MKSGNLNFLEPSGPLQACHGTALPLPLPFIFITMHDSRNEEFIRNHGKQLVSLSVASLTAVLNCLNRLVQKSAGWKCDVAADKNIARLKLVTALEFNKNYAEIFGPLQPDFRKNLPFRKVPRFCYY